MQRITTLHYILKKVFIHMKRTLIDINELSDSKEVYGQRPNPFIAVFIYSILALLLAAVIYSCFGKIEIVATSSGIVRPNEDVSTVSTLLSGRITGVYYTDGQIVRKGDSLLTLDTSELQITLNSLQATKEEYTTKISMMDKFIAGIEAGKNPFSSDTKSTEYPYYIQFKDYELTKKNSKEEFDYDADTASANISFTNQRITDIEKQLAGLKAYKESIETSSNQAASYPEYEQMYLLYTAAIDALDADYKTKREQIELNQTAESNQYYSDYYNALIADYELLVSSIEKDYSVFPAGNNSVCGLLWNDYKANLDEYKRQYTAAVDTYEQCLTYANSGTYSDDLLSYDRTMLEGYQYFKQSVASNTDLFDSNRDSVYYRSLYTEYKAEYDRLEEVLNVAEEQYQLILNDSASTEDEIEQALSAKNNAEAACSSYKSNTLVTINNSILKIQSSIAEKEYSINNASSAYNVSSAKTQMESAEAAVSAYKNQKYAEYKQVLEDYKSKKRELEFAAAESQDKSALLADLKSSHKNAVEQKYYQTITQIDSSIQALQAELISAQANLKLYQIANNMYQSSVDENGLPIFISLSTMNEISSLLSQQDSLSFQLNELNTQIQQTEEKVSQSCITAEQSGTVSVISTLVNGDSITAGTQIATIIPPSESEYKVQLYVSNSDIANITVGDDVKFNLLALPRNQYGLISGKVTSISTDTLTQNGQYSGYYLVECSIANTTLTDKDGNSGSVVIGMQVEAKIITQKKTIIRYLLEKIDLY